MSDLPPPTPPALYVTAPTREKLGWMANEIPRWSGMDTIIITMDDLRRYMGADTPTAENLHKKDFPKLADTFRMIARDLKYDLPVLMENELPGGAASDTTADQAFSTENLIRQRMATSVLTAVLGPSTTAYNPQNLDHPNTLCIIGIPDFDHPVDLSGVPAGFSRFTLTDSDILFAEVAHETGHCKQNVTTENLLGERLYGEIEADQHVINIAESLTDEAPVNKADLPDQLIAMRALGTVLRADYQHATAIGLNPEGPDPDYTAFLESGRQSRHIGVYDRLPQATQERLAVNQRQIVSAFKTIALRLASDPLFLPGMKAQSIEDQRHFIYSTINQMNEEGAFKASAVQQRLATQFLQAANRYAPDYFQPQPHAVGPGPTPRTSGP